MGNFRLQVHIYICIHIYTSLDVLLARSQQQLHPHWHGGQPGPCLDHFGAPWSFELGLGYKGFARRGKTSSGDMIQVLGFSLQSYWAPAEHVKQSSCRKPRAEFLIFKSTFPSQDLLCSGSQIPKSTGWVGGGWRFSCLCCDWLPWGPRGTWNHCPSSFRGS